MLDTSSPMMPEDVHLNQGLDLGCFPPLRPVPQTTVLPQVMLAFPNEA